MVCTGYADLEPSSAAAILRSKEMNQPRLLLADSQNAMLEAIKSLLEPEFEIVGTVHDKKSLHESADTLKPDIAVVDFSMLGFDLTVVRQLKNRNPELKLIILSVYDEALVVRETLAAGALGYVFKWICS